MRHSNKDVVERRLSGRFQVSLVWEGALVGALVGVLVTAYRLVLTHGERFVEWVSATLADRPALLAPWLLALCLAAFVVGLLVRWEPDTAGSGIPQVDAEVMGARSMRWWRVLPAKFVEGAIGAFAGLSLGREGPSVQLGGMVGKGVSQGLGRGRGEERLLVTCGASAGMAAAFHAPLTGVMFAVEEIHKSFSAPVVISVMCAAVLGDYVASQLLGLSPVVVFTLSEFVPHEWYGMLAAFGVAMGLVSCIHNAGMFLAQDVLSRLRFGAPFVRLLIPFALCGVCALVAPLLLCGGDAIVEVLRRPQGLTAAVLAGLLVGKFVLTCVCFGSGAPGGTLFPLVAMGALAGALLGEICIGTFGLDRVLVSNFMVLGIAGLFAGVVRAPVTAVVLAFELTGSLDALLSVTLVSVLSYTTANLLKVDAYYEHLVARLLGIDVEHAHERWASQGRQLHAFTVTAGSEACGSSVLGLGLPAGVLIVTVTRHGRRLVPHGSTVLEAGDQLLVLFDQDNASQGEALVRQLVREPDGKVLESR